MQDQFEDTTEVTKSRKLKKDRHYNDQKKINKEQIMIYKPLLRELKIKQREIDDKS